MADITKLGGGGPVEIDGTFTTTGTGTHSGACTYSGTCTHGGNVTHSGHTTQTGAHCGTATITTAAGTAAALLDSPYQLITSSNGSHKVKMPLAHAAGQLIIILNTSSTHAAVVRNNADDGNVIASLGVGKIASCISTAAGDNWIGHQLN